MEVFDPLLNKINEEDEEDAKNNQPSQSQKELEELEKKVKEELEQKILMRMSASLISIDPVAQASPRRDRN